MSEGVIIALITLVGTILPAWWGHRNAMRKKDESIAKLKKANRDLEYALKSESIRGSVLDKVLELSSLNDIKLSIDEVFDHTKADRFLILIAVNGKVDFNVVSVIYEQHKQKAYPLNAIARYRNIKVGEPYRRMLKEVELNTAVILKTDKMQEGILKNIYLTEGVKHSIIRHLMRLNIDEDNDLIIYSSMSTHSDQPFTNQEMVFFGTMYDSAIITSLKRMIVQARKG